jgi:hypothetical protein
MQVTGKDPVSKHNAMKVYREKKGKARGITMARHKV